MLSTLRHCAAAGKNTAPRMQSTARCIGGVVGPMPAVAFGRPRLVAGLPTSTVSVRAAPLHTARRIATLSQEKRPTVSVLLLQRRGNASSSRGSGFSKEDGPKSEKEGAAGEAKQGPSDKKESVRNKVVRAWSTPTTWYRIPVLLGALVLVAVQYRKHLYGITEDGYEVVSQREGGAVVRPTVDGPWQVRILGALPLRSMSQLWGYLNHLVLPVWFRPFGFKLYAYIFGCNLDECAQADLTQYESLGEFFYRELKPGARPIADASLVSPSDGRVLHLGEIRGEKVEQVKGMTYSLEALLGTESQAHGALLEIGRQGSSPSVGGQEVEHVVDDEHFANINSIPYSLGSLIGKDDAAELKEDSNDVGAEHDASVRDAGGFAAHDAHVAARLGMRALGQSTDKETDIGRLNPNHKLCFIVIYLAPGDYHRFHSPTAWVVERRRHFTGDLFSVSPYVANRLRNLFVLNERVALLGRWKNGFFSMVPVGATNVGSIIINFDKNLRTNTSTPTHPAHTFTEAVYSSASVLQGQPLLAGEEMGGFKLGSTIVLVFEAPKSFKFTVKPGETVRVGEQLGTD